jgi:hypothetical protein
MAVTFVSKTKAQVEPGQQKKTSYVQDVLMNDLKLMAPELAEKRWVVDEYTSKLKIAKQDYDVVETRFLEHVEGLSLSPTAKLLVEAEGVDVLIGGKGKERKVSSTHDVFALLEMIKPGLAFELMNFKLTDLDKYLTPDQLNEVLEIEFGKKRSIKVLKK